jgi:sugar O-acyltransferase (sialic acid O-acetyltransferase NeuD family)
MSSGIGSVRPLVVIGSGGFGRETVEAVRAVNSERPTWDLLGFLDDDSALHGSEIDGVPVLGAIDDARTKFETAALVVCTGHPGNYFSRKRIVDRLGLPAIRYATVVHPTAVLPTTLVLGVGTVLLAQVVATTAVRIGSHVAVMPDVVFTHDDIVEDFTTFGAGSRLAGRVRISEGAYVGSGALVREERTVGKWALVGMGAVVTHDVPAAEVWSGVPARRVRSIALPDELIRSRDQTDFEPNRANSARAETR